MGINIFQGTRRLTYVIYALSVLGVFLGNLNSTIYISYQTDSPTSAFYRVDNSYSCNGSSDYIYSNPEYSNLWINLCFKSSDFNGQNLIPYLVFEDKIYGGSRYDNAVNSYIEKRKAEFSIPKDDHNYILGERGKNYLLAIAYSLITLIGLLSFFFVIGWIIRGFAGIPIDRDFRDDIDCVKTGNDNTALLLKKILVNLKAKKTKKSQQQEKIGEDELSAEGADKKDEKSGLKGGIFIALIIIFGHFGGIIGGAIGGIVGAYITNLIDSDKSKTRKTIYSVLSIVAGALVYCIVIALIYIYFPNLFPIEKP